jgi:hypothetical protein
VTAAGQERDVLARLRELGPEVSAHTARAEHEERITTSLSRKNSMRRRGGAMSPSAHA